MLNIATVETIDSTRHAAPDSAEQTGMLGDVLRDGCSYLDDLGRFLSTVSGLFRVGNSVEANRTLAELISGLGLLLQTIDTVGAVMGPQFDASLPANQSLDSLASNLNGVLTEILHAQERKDQVLLADLLEYELAPCLEGWKGIFSALLADLS